MPYVRLHTEARPVGCHRKSSLKLHLSIVHQHVKKTQQLASIFNLLHVSIHYAIYETVYHYLLGGHGNVNIL